MATTTSKPKPKTSPTVAAVQAAFTRFGMAPARMIDMIEAHDFAEGLIGGKIASPEALWRVQRRSGAGVFLYHEEERLTGIVANVLLSPAGLKAIWDETFDALDPAPRHICREADEPAAVYAWGIAASNHPAAKQMLDALGAMVTGAIPHLTFFGRVATPAGRRLAIERIGFKPVPDSTTDLLWIEPFNQRAPAAAA